MPLARKLRPIPAAFQHLGENRTTLVLVPLVLRNTTVAGRVPNTRLMRKLPRQQQRPRRATLRHVVHLAKTQTIPSQRIDIRSVDLGVIAAKI